VWGGGRDGGRVAVTCNCQQWLGEGEG
jgi:hypothetical protein